MKADYFGNFVTWTDEHDLMLNVNVGGNYFDGENDINDYFVMPSTYYGEVAFILSE